MTLFDLIFKSMRKNIKHYYLYFFALIFSISLYFIFSTLSHDETVSLNTGSMATAFNAAGVLLIVITGVFVIYANAIFLRRRSREIGLYQLIGLTRAKVGKLLIIENVLLSSGALLIGIAIGLLVSRLFLLLLMKLVGFDGFISISFSMDAVLQTLIVFLAIIVLTSLQMVWTIYRTSLINLFNADKTGEIPKKSGNLIAAILAILGLALIIFGYWFSGRMLNEMLLFNMLIVLAATIFGTYLLFRVTIGWMLYKVRVSKKGFLSLSNSLSLASLMHRMKANANSLTIITVLSAMTLTMLAGSYSLYYSTEKETRYIMPFDFSFEEADLDESDITSQEFEDQLQSEGIDYKKGSVELLAIEGDYEEGIFPPIMGKMDKMYSAYAFSAQQLQEAGLDIDTPGKGEIIYHSYEMSMLAKDLKTPFKIKLTSSNTEESFNVVKIGEGDVMNAIHNIQIIMNDEDFENYKRNLDESLIEERYYGNHRFIETYNLSEESDLKLASEIRRQNQEEGAWAYGIDYYSMYENALKSNGLFIFIAGFLGLVFLLSTGSILYFKQMTEAEQERAGYKTLRQLGFSVKEIMRGIIRKQSFVFGLPLVIGLLHSIFAIKAASFLFMSDIRVPTIIAMGTYALIYLIFAILSLGYYKKIVKEVL